MVSKTYALILAAGYGTRMGPIGELIPKVLWPIFEKKILDLQVAFVRQFGIDEIFVNTHFLAEKVYAHSQSLSLKTLNESEILGTGGAIHNMAKHVNYQGRLLVLNGDQFLFFNHEFYDQLMQSLQQYDICLSTINVPKGDGYSGLKLERGHLKSIEADRYFQSNEFPTYSGVCSINLSKLKRVEGFSHFFKSVADPQEKSVKCLYGHDFEYWDFGTKARYYQSIFTLLAKPESSFYQFLKSYGAIDESKMNRQILSYHSQHPNQINLTGALIGDRSPNKIILGDQGKIVSNPRHGIRYNELVCYIEN